MNELDAGGSVKLEGKAIVTNRTRKMREDENRIEFLNVDTVLGWRGVGAIMSTEIYRKEAAVDLYIQANSAHPESLNTVMIKKEVIRYVRCARKRKDSIRRGIDSQKHGEKEDIQQNNWRKQEKGWTIGLDSH